MTADTGDIETATRIARALVSAFQTALLPKGASRDSVVLLPTMETLKTEDLIVQLAGLPKPVTCVGFGNSAGLTLGYWVPPETGDSFIRRELRTHFRRRPAH